MRLKTKVNSIDDYKGKRSILVLYHELEDGTTYSMNVSRRDFSGSYVIENGTSFVYGDEKNKVFPDMDYYLDDEDAKTVCEFLNVNTLAIPFFKILPHPEKLQKFINQEKMTGLTDYAQAGYTLSDMFKENKHGYSFKVYFDELGLIAKYYLHNFDPRSLSEKQSILNLYGLTLEQYERLRFNPDRVGMDLVRELALMGVPSVSYHYLVKDDMLHRSASFLERLIDFYGTTALQGEKTSIRHRKLKDLFDLNETIDMSTYLDLIVVERDDDA